MCGSVLAKRFTNSKALFALDETFHKYCPFSSLVVVFFSSSVKSAIDCSNLVMSVIIKLLDRVLITCAAISPLLLRVLRLTLISLKAGSSSDRGISSNSCSMSLTTTLTVFPSPISY